MQNVELKARYDDLQRAARVARALGATRQWRRRQTDTYFATPRGRIKVRRVPGQPAELIAYHRADTATARPSSYHICSVPDGAALCRTLSMVLDTLVVVDKVRTLYLLDNVRIHLDTVRGIGSFIEFEAVLSHPPQEAAATARVKELCTHFGITQEHIVATSYAELLLARSRT
ncbi:MAG: class IV adenylate cyclase [candidate division KSB1 bacterium]|nr:class IV adenylate cyclase [candidate division KSB1 bacterium]